ncbi:MAG: fatty acid--CoA ligase [Gammaproteobacteria bacterium]|nr:MAG: fatty acid--CoA ligase [Gammaproteobacteria bacterium]
MAQAPATIDAVETLADLCRFQARERPEKTALAFGDRSTSYVEFDALTNRVANGLMAEGVGPKSRVAFLDKNSDRFYEIVLGAAKANAVSVGINWRLAPPEVAYVVNDSGAEVMFVGPDFFPLVAKIVPELTTVRRIIGMAPGHGEWVEYGDWRDAQLSEDPEVPCDRDDICIQMYTSGTTGHPKGVQLANRAFFDLRREPSGEGMEWNEWTDTDVSLVAMPSFHIGGAGWGIQGLMAGATNIVLDEFEPGRVLDTIAENGITKLFMVPAAMRLCLHHPQCAETDFSSIKYMLYGASPIPLDLLREAIRVFKCGFVQLYGMTETTGTATYLPPEDHDPTGANEKMKSAGKPLPGVELKVVDDDNQPLPPRAVGEICINSKGNMSGYWNLPDATAATLIDGFVHTGDAGYLDEDGYVYVHDRVKDMIVSGAENVYPAEVENAIFGHHAVADVAVIGIPDEKWGEAVKAVVVLKPGSEASANEIIGFARERIAGFKCPKSVDFIAELPRNPSGKILKRELRKPYWEGRERMVN